MVTTPTQRIALFGVSLQAHGLQADMAVLGDNLPAKVEVILPHPIGNRWVEIPQRFQELEFTPGPDQTSPLFLKFYEPTV